MSSPDWERTEPRSFLARQEDRASPEQEQSFLYGEMLPPVGPDAIRRRAAAWQQAMAKAIWEAMHARLGAEEPNWEYTAYNVATRFGSTNRKPVDALFTGTGWGSTFVTLTLAARFDVAVVHPRLLPGGDDLTEAEQTAELLRTATGKAQSLAAALGQAVDDLREVEELTEATASARRTAEQARRAAIQEAQEAARRQRRH